MKTTTVAALKVTYTNKKKVVLLQYMNIKIKSITMQSLIISCQLIMNIGTEK